MAALEELPLTPLDILGIATAAEAAMKKGALTPDWTTTICDFIPKKGSEQ